MAFIRDEKLLCLFNLGREEVAVDLPDLGTPKLLAESGFTARFESGEAILPPLGAAFAEVGK